MTRSMDIKVDNDAISDARKGIQAQLEDELDASMADMRSSIEALADMWEGPNHDDFLASFEGRFESLATFNKMLVTYRRAMMRAWSAYNTCEDDVSDYVR